MQNIGIIEKRMDVLIRTELIEIDPKWVSTKKMIFCMYLLRNTLGATINRLIMCNCEC